MVKSIVPQTLSLAEYRALLRRDLVSFAQCCFRELNPRTRFAMNWHVEIIAAKLMAVRDGAIRRLVVNLPPRHLKSLLASVAFPAWCLGHDPSAQILCVSYAQDLADKLSRDCRQIVASDWYRSVFPTRLSPQRAAMPEFDTTAQGCRLATSVGGVLTGRGADLIVIDDPLEARGGVVANPAPGGERLVRPHPLQPIERQAHRRDRPHHAPIARRRPHRPCIGAGGVGDRALPGDRRGGRGAARRHGAGAATFRAPPRRGVARGARALGGARAYPPHDRRIQFRGAIPAGARPIGRRPRQGGLVRALRARRGAAALRAHRAELGHRQQGDRAQRFQRVHELGRRGQEPLPDRRVAPAHGIPRIEARGARAIRAVRALGRADRGQGLGHAIDPGTDRRRPPRRHPLPPADRTKSCACTRRPQ